MDQSEIAIANDEYHRWLITENISNPGGLSAYDGFLAAMELMLGNPPSVRNLQAKISELEERLRTIGGKHAEQVRDLEYQIANQASLIQDRNNKIHDLEIEIQDWKKRLDDYSRTYQVQVEDQHRSEINEAVAAAIQEALHTAARETAQGLLDQKEHFEQVKEAALSAQGQVMLHEFEQRLAGDTLRSGYLSRQEHLGAMRHQKEALEVSHQEAMERAEQEIRELQLKLAAASSFPLSDLLEDRISTRIDEMVPILKAMVAIELRQKPARKPAGPILPTMEDFEYWYDQIPDFTMSDKDKFRLGWQGALRQVR